MKKITLIILSYIVFVSNPVIAQEVGTLPGNFSVSPSGAAVYSIPIDLPPGRAGMTPELAFVYNNHSPSTIMGQGWGISGFSSIGRANPTLYYNDEVDNVDFTDDQLILDGNRLIEVGSEGSNIIYRTEMDGISKIVYLPSGGYNNKDYFKVFTKSGLIKEYGKTNNSRQTYPDDNAEPLFWHLSKIIDRQNNAVIYTYSKDTYSGELHPHTIEYTIHGEVSSNLSSYIVEFGYSDLDEKMHQTFYFEDQFGEAYLNKNIKRLDSVLVKQVDGGMIIKEYDMNYISESSMAGEYFLESITTSASNDGVTMKSFNPTTFEWHYFESEKTYEKEFEEIICDPTFHASNYVLGKLDMTGNGIDELVDYKENYSGELGDPYRTIELRSLNSALEITVDEGFDETIRSLTGVDFDNDGKDELMVGMSGKVWIYKFTESSGTWSANRIDNDLLFVDGEYHKPFAGDFTGDGLADMLLVDKEGDLVEAVLYICTGIESGLFESETFSFDVANTGYDMQQINSLADFNGDGKTDIALEKRDNIYANDIIEYINYRIEIHSFTGNGFEKLTSLSIYNDNAPDYNDNIIYADFNGDGRTDIHHQRSPEDLQNDEERTTYLSYGKGFDATETTESTVNNASGAMFVSDQNNDGRADIIYINYYFINKWMVTTRTYFTTPAGLNNDYVEETVDVDPGLGEIAQITFGDFSGNGINDLAIGLWKEGDEIDHPASGKDRMPRTKLYSLIAINDVSTLPGNVITGITNGFGVKREITYQSSRNTYQEPASYDYPLALYKSKTWLVDESYIVGEAGNTLNHMKYTFNTPLVMLRGKGFIGFNKITVTDYQQNTETTSDYYILKPTINGKEMYFMHFPRTVITTEIGENGKMLSRTMNEVNIKNTVAGYDHVFLPVTTQSRTLIRDNDDQNSFIKSTVISQLLSDVDIYGNSLKQTTVTIGEKSFTTVMQSTYLIDQSNWVVNRPYTTTITKSLHGEADDVVQIAHTYYTDDSFPLLHTKTVTPNGSNTLKTMVTYEYDQFGNISKETLSAPGDPTLEERTTLYTYDTGSGYDGRFLTEVKKEFSPADYVTHYTYQPNTGKILTETDVSGRTTTYTYDEFNRLYTATYPDGTTSTFNYLWATEAKGMTPPGAMYSTMSRSSGSAPIIHFFDKYQRELRQVSYGLNTDDEIYVDKTYYPTDGRLYKAYEPRFATESADLYTEFEYDALGRLETKTTAVNSFTYNYKGRETSITDNGTGIETTNIVNAFGKPLSVTDPSGTIYYTYFSNGQPKSIDALGAVTTMQYDAAGNQTQLNEPNAGITNYVYNAYGELVEQTDARQNKYQMQYDIFGRLVNKTLVNTGEQTIYNYINAPNHEFPGMGFGKLGSVNGPNNISYYYQYDINNRLSKKTEHIEGQNYEELYSYDNNGRLQNYTYPSGFSVSYGYSLSGHLKTVSENEYNSTIWQADEKNSRGQLTDFTLGNGLSTHRGFDDYGFPEEIITGNVQDLGYEFDQVTGNLTSRSSDYNGVTLHETFGYDTQLQSRLTSWQVSGQQEYTAHIQSNGNILTKTDVTQNMPYSIYQYTNAGPHAVTNVHNPTPAYQSFAGAKQSATYTAFNKVETINRIEDEGGANETRYGIDIMYGPDNLRKKVTHTKDRGILKTKYYIGANYEIVVDDNGEEWIYHYIKAENGIFAIYKWGMRFKGMYYVHKDYLGSFETITDGSGQLEEMLSFDPWGRRRNATDWTFSNVPENYLFDRGYTGHEHFDNFDLINMNGRVYDPWLGRFLSPDPIVQAPNYSQSYNRYSYVFNNPLKYVDPTGYEGGPYGPPSPYAYGEGSASPGMGFFEFNYMPWGSNINNRQTFMNSGFGRLDVMYKLDHQRAVVKELWQKSTLTNYPASVVEQIVGMLQEGFMLNLVEANGNSVLVLSRGELGNTIVGLDGGVRFENSTAGVYFGTAVVGEGMPWMGIAMQELGQSEVLGSNHNPKIVEYLKTTGSWWNSDETAWCSGFVNWAVSKSNIIGTNSARALSWKNWGNSISQASYGSIAILDYNNGRGHVGFVLGQNLNGDIILLGGNQSNMVNLSVFPANEIDGYIYPTGHSSSYFLPIFNIYGITNFNQTR